MATMSRPQAEQARFPHRGRTRALACVWASALARAMTTALLCTIVLLSLLGASCGVHSEAVKVSGRQARPWVVLLCKSSDVSAEPHPLAWYEQMFLDQGTGADNVFSYFLDQSYGSITLEGTQIKGWYTVPKKASDVTAATLGSNRWQGAQMCADAAKAKGDVDFSQFTKGGIVALWNVDVNGGSQKHAVQVGDLSFPFVLGDGVPGKLDLTTISFLTHEMLHGFGLDHAHGPYPNPGAHALTLEVDHGATHTWGANQWEEYGDCWTIMGCGAWTIPDGGLGLGEEGPGLGAAQRDYLGWMPKGRVFSWDRSGTLSVALAPVNTPLVAGPLLLKIPLGDQGTYTVEFVDNSGWNQNVLRRAVLIHEVRADSPTNTYLIGRDKFGGWMPGQVFLDPDNHVRISIDSFGTTASLTLSPSGPGDGGKLSCDPGCGPSVYIEAPLGGAHAPVGLPVTLSATVYAPFQPIADNLVIWRANGTQIETGRSASHTFSVPGTYSLAVTAYDTAAGLSFSQTQTLTIDPPPPPGKPIVTITQPTDGQGFAVDPPAYLTSIEFVAAGSSDIASYDWVDSVLGYLGSGQDLRAPVHMTTSGNCAHESHVITLTGKTSAGASATASITITLKSTQCIR